MIISRTPFRISFFGGGTDYPEWYLKEGGAVLSTTIDKYCYINCRYLPPFFNIKHRVVWSHIETVSTISEILHPAVREGLRYLGFDDSLGLEIHHLGDLPARAGIGSSSAFSVGLIKALTAMRGQLISKHDLAMKAIELERVVLKEHVGSQDQIAVSYGGLNLIHFLPGGDFQVDPISLPTDILSSRLMLFYLGTTRLSSDISKDITSNLQSKKTVLKQMRTNVDVAVDFLRSGLLDDFGRLLHESWILKRELSTMVTNPTIDMIYQKALDSGALGGKILGAGASGFMVFYVPQERQNEVRKALFGLLEVPFQFESEGSTLIYYDSDDTRRLNHHEQ
ncbi:MAG: GHMP kinase [Anaerolineales bacterium]|nr:GHMP kinase [Anaerolineales bacterium]